MHAREIGFTLVIGRHVMPISEKGAPASHFSSENDRERRSGGRKWLATGLEGRRGPKSEIRDRKIAIRVYPWLDRNPRSEVRDRWPERLIYVDLREFAVVFGVLGALEGLQTRFSTVPTSFESRETQIHANEGSGGNLSRNTGNLAGKQERVGPSSCFPDISCFPA